MAKDKSWEEIKKAKIAQAAKRAKELADFEKTLDAKEKAAREKKERIKEAQLLKESADARKKREEREAKEALKQKERDRRDAFSEKRKDNEKILAKQLSQLLVINGPLTPTMEALKKKLAESLLQARNSNNSLDAEKEFKSLTRQVNMLAGKGGVLAQMKETREKEQAKIDKTKEFWDNVEQSLKDKWKDFNTNVRYQLRNLGNKFMRGLDNIGIGFVNLGNVVRASKFVGKSAWNIGKGAVWAGKAAYHGAKFVQNKFNEYQEHKSAVAAAEQLTGGDKKASGGGKTEARIVKAFMDIAKRGKLFHSGAKKFMGDQLKSLHGIKSAIAKKASAAGGSVMDSIMGFLPMLAAAIPTAIAAIGTAITAAMPALLGALGVSLAAWASTKLGGLIYDKFATQIQDILAWKRDRKEQNDADIKALNAAGTDTSDKSRNTDGGAYIGHRNSRRSAASAAPVSTPATGDFGDQVSRMASRTGGSVTGSGGLPTPVSAAPTSMNPSLTKDFVGPKPVAGGGLTGLEKYQTGSAVSGNATAATGAPTPPLTSTPITAGNASADLINKFMPRAVATGNASADLINKFMPRAGTALARAMPEAFSVPKSTAGTSEGGGESGSVGPTSNGAGSSGQQISVMSIPMVSSIDSHLTAMNMGMFD